MSTNIACTDNKINTNINQNTKQIQICNTDGWQMVREGALWMRVMNMETRWELWRLGPSSPSNDASQSVIRPVRENEQSEHEIAVTLIKRVHYMCSSQTNPMLTGHEWIKVADHCVADTWPMKL